jgi:hypothetical protein
LIDDMTKARFQALRRRVARLAVPELIELLESPQLATRFAAEMRLRELAGL